ncbi:MAG: hypothetical protein AAGI52_01540 [Bacteroidota bacterium]
MPHADLSAPSSWRAAGESLVALSVATDGRLFVLGAEGIQPVPREVFASYNFTTVLNEETIGTGGLAPSDLDATNGQDFYVADGARVLRFSDEGLLVQTLDIASVDAPPIATGPTLLPGEAVAVAAGADGQLYVAEVTRGTVQVWRDGALADVLGGVGQPVALASRGRTLYVADASLPGVRVLGANGREVRQIRDEHLETVVSISLAGDTLVALSREAVVLFGADGARLHVVPISGGAALLDAVVVDGRLFVLTSDAVHGLGRLE